MEVDSTPVVVAEGLPLALVATVSNMVELEVGMSSSLVVSVYSSMTIQITSIYTL